jgi:hypothetical protein
MTAARLLRCAGCAEPVEVPADHGPGDLAICPTCMPFAAVRPEVLEVMKLAVRRGFSLRDLAKDGGPD